MEYGHLFECFMLVCFGFSWPLNVIKAYKAGTTKGTSLAFIFLIITGYLAGITAKLINHQVNYVLAVYFINLAIVMLNVLVYIRNKKLDKKVILVKEGEEKKEENMNYTYSLDELINPMRKSSKEEKNAVILLGSESDRKIPVQGLGKEFKFNFKIYNKSSDDFSLTNALPYFMENIASLSPEGILIHLGQSDVSLCINDGEKFDNLYLALIKRIRQTNKKCRIALVSVANPDSDKTVNIVNRHIKAIAASERCSFVNLDSVKLWNPQATKAALDFAYNMGLNTRKPLSDVAEILYSYAYHNHGEDSSVSHMVG